jgi:hypothetical protein
MRFSGAVLGVGLTAAAALGQGAGQPRRGAVLLPPQPADPPVVARAAAEELPAFPGSTPVTRAAARPAGTPAWPGRYDHPVRPAGGAAPDPMVPPAQPQPTALAKGIDKLKGAFASEKPDRVAVAPPPAPDATSPFRGTTANGAPVYAGPPAYRWYGWGSVTPGGNPFAPAGQYPKASAHWHSVTGATPGAFPVPVADPTRPGPGAEPPAYAAAPAMRTPPPAAPPPPARPLPVVPTPTPEPPYLPPTPAPAKPAAVATPTLTPPPVVAPITLAPLLPREADAAPAPPLPTLPVLPPVTVPAGGPVEPPKPATPAADDTPQWQPKSVPAPAGGGDWKPGGR